MLVDGAGGIKMTKVRLLINHQMHHLVSRLTTTSTSLFDLFRMERSFYPRCRSRTLPPP